MEHNNIMVNHNNSFTIIFITKVIKNIVNNIYEIVNNLYEYKFSNEYDKSYYKIFVFILKVNL